VKLLELEDMEEGSRILIPLARVPQLNLRPAGTSLEEIRGVLSSEFEQPPEDEDENERRALIEKLITDGSPVALARALKRLHLLRQTEGLDREQEQMRKKVRSWLAAEISIAKECTRAESQAFMTRILQETVATHEQKEKEEAKERRRAAREQKKAEAALAEEAASPSPVSHDVDTPEPVAEPSPDAPEGEAPIATGTEEDHPIGS